MSTNQKTQHTATVGKVAETMRSNIGLLRILFNQLGHKEMCPKRLVILAEINERWNFDENESRVVDALLRSAIPVGGRDVVDYNTFVKLIRQPGASATGRRRPVAPAIAAVTANIPQAPARPLGTSTTTPRAAGGANPSIANYLDEVDYSKELLARNVTRELTDCLNGVARNVSSANGGALLGAAGAHTLNHGAPSAIGARQDYALTLPQYTKGVRQFEDRVSPLQAKSYFVAAAQLGGTPKAGGGEGGGLGGAVKVSHLVKTTISHLPLTRHKAFSSEQVRETFNWPVSFLEEYGHAEPQQEGTGGHGGYRSPAVGAGRNVPRYHGGTQNSANRTTRTVDLKRMVTDLASAKNWEVNQQERNKFSVWSPRRLAAEGRTSPRSAKRPHHPPGPNTASGASSPRSSRVA